MLDIPRMQRIRLNARSFSQRLVARTLLAPVYESGPGVNIHFEGFERVPRTPVIYAMNHTDRFNYFPFQYRLYRQHDRYTATWVKGKYYETAFVGAFMERTNNIPTVSRGYILTHDFIATMGRRPEGEEYRAARSWLDAHARGDADFEPDLDALPAPLRERARVILGRPFAPDRETYAEAVDDVFRTMMRRFVELNAETFGLGLDLLVFPQGTRSIRLSRGHIGIAQIALRYEQTIVPVGCNGSDKLHPGSNPFARWGDVTYRFGEPIPYEAMVDHHIGEDFEPFSPEAEAEHRGRFQGLVDMVMDRIDDLVDPEYKYADEQASGGVTGSDRFI